MPEPDRFPAIHDLGLCAKLVTFADGLSEAANRAALALRAAVEAEGWTGVEETSISLASTVIRFDPLALPHAELEARLAALLAGRDWYAAPLPTGRTLWRIPVALGGAHGPQWEEAASLAGRDPEAARAEILSSRTRVLTLGFAPGQPYMGELPPNWDIPRMTELNPQVPGASLVVAIRQLIIFAGPAPTGWRHIGQTAFQCFRPGAAAPIALAPGDEVTWREVSAEELAEIQAEDRSGDGGATREALP
ncbi:Allophanate hydrolase 2 subunit 1 [Candidatus Rhodobacter oscarellae]|uniref:Allophanate hydrolase 2 subunit 1 n=1 Tax=Candidatus Rhodobacter oscarellae TaxID=1675527 RepID=A0A0J9E7A3_9RHOB|nr:carboxyltransferase domain-containing protein [Candidatus Rhodobacter lobularis]KMW57659.1 Allophanate hydrolase 2 subunit 1 [Candidatus Rhodobacter lobularis]